MKVNDCTKIIELLKKEREDNRELYHLRIKDLEEERVFNHRLKDDISSKNAEINALKSRIIQLERLVRERNGEIEQLCSNQPREKRRKPVKATFHLTISMRGQRATGKIQTNNYHHRICGTSLTSKTSSVSLIFTQGTHRNVKNR